MAPVATVTSLSPAVSAAATVAAADYYKVTWHGFENGSRWLEKWSCACTGGSNPIADVKAASAILSAARRQLMSAGASINGVTIAYLGPTSTRNKSRLFRDKASGCGVGLIKTSVSAAEEPWMALIVNFPDVNYTVRETRPFRGICELTTANYGFTGPYTAASPELGGLQAMSPILAATAPAKGPGGGTVTWGIPSGNFLTGSVVPATPIFVFTTSTGYLTVATNIGVGPILKGPLGSGVPIVPGDSIKVRGLKSGCYKGINGVATVVSVQDVGGQWWYLTNKVVCCGSGSLLNWTGYAWLNGFILFPYAPYTAPDVDGVAKRATGVTGLGVRRGRRPTRCCRPAPTSF